MTSDHLDRDHGTPLRQVVAVYQLDDGAPFFAVEIDYLDEYDNHAMSIVCRFPDPDERDNWLHQIRAAANAAALADPNPISPENHQMAARIVEFERDYDPSNYAVYKVVQRANKIGARSSSEDLTKIGSTICFLAIGLHKIHLIPLLKRGPITSTPQLAGYTANSPKTYGILTLTGIRLGQDDDNLDLIFRMPLQQQKTLHLASLASRDIASRFRQVEEFLRPEWESRPYFVQDPDHTRADSIAIPAGPPVDADSFDRTLIAYCVSYHIKPDNIRYFINRDIEDGPRFELLPPTSRHLPQYSELELLAIMRSLRYNETFGSISFANINLDALNDLYEEYGTEHLCSRTKRGTNLKMNYDDLSSARVLVQELRALAITNRKLRRMDFTSCILRKPRNSDDEGNGVRDQGCGIAEALFPLCKLQITNVDWLVLSGIHLGETDLDYLVGAAVDRSCHFRALEMSDCGLTDRSLMLLLDSLRAQDDTMESIEISRNLARLSPSTFGPQLGVFGFLRKLNLAHLSRTSDPESLIPLDTLMTWRLEELILSGTSVNAATLDVICRYLLSSRSDLLRELRLDHSYLSSRDISQLMRAVARHPGGLPLLHVDLSQNELEKDHQHLTDAIREGLTPTMLTIRLMEYEEETYFRELVQALTNNTKITHLDISRASLPTEVSEETCQALERLFSDNVTLQYLDISGEDSRLETSKLGVGISNSLSALRNNTALQCLRIQCQNLGLRGAHILADIIKTNATLREVHCENNGIPLSGFMDIVNALETNTTLQYLSGAEDSQTRAHHLAELQIKALRDEYQHQHAAPISKTLSIRDKFASKVGATSKPKASQNPNRRSRQVQVSEALSAIDDLDKVWARQMGRLATYLYRNQCIANGIPWDPEPEETPMSARPAMNRGSSVLTIEKILAGVVDVDATPKVEKDDLMLKIPIDEEPQKIHELEAGDIVGSSFGNPVLEELDMGSKEFAGSDRSSSDGPTPDGLSPGIQSPTLASPALEADRGLLEEFEDALSAGSGSQLLSPVEAQSPRSLIRAVTS